MKKNYAIIGSQWGDEGKGKIVDCLSNDFNAVVRYQGGNNAGHTVIFDNKKVVLHLLPSGIFSQKAINIISHGVVIEPNSLINEINMVKSIGYDITPYNLCISPSATIITSYSILLDKAREQSLGSSKIGTTGKGIGPSYEDHISRKSIKVIDLLNKNTLLEKLNNLYKEKLFLLSDFYKLNDIPTINSEAERLFDLGSKLKQYIQEEINVIDNCFNNGNILYEGAQGVMLDVDFGTYPFVTSSNTTAGGIFTGSYVPKFALNKVIGITKAYTTRVGSGSFPSEINNAIGEQIQKIGNEFGATTGRKRRCGWLDLAQLKYATKVSNLTEIALTKIDVLMNLKELKIVTSYKYKNEIYDRYHLGMDTSLIEPIYESLNPLEGNISKDYIPQSVREYMSFIENKLNIPITMLSYGPDRSEIIKFEDG